MQCPFCQTENRDDRASCYHCTGDLVPLRALVNKAKNLYNEALEHAERGRSEAAISNLRTAIELDASFANAWVVLGTIFARERRVEEARAAWEKALAIDPRMEKAHQYLEKLERVRAALPAVEGMKTALAALAVAVAALSVALAWVVWPSAPASLPGESSGGSLWLWLGAPIAAAIAGRVLLDLPRISARAASLIRGKK